MNTTNISKHKHLTEKTNPINIVACSKKNTPRECNPTDLLAKGASAPFGIALFLCQKFTIFMVSVSWESSDCRNLLLGLQTRFTPIAQRTAILGVGLKPLAKGKDHAYSIQHSSSQQSATLQNPNPFNSIALYAFKNRNHSPLNCVGGVS